MNAIQTTIDELDDLLEDERSALLSGDLEKIRRLNDRKAQLVDSLRDLDLRDREEMNRLNQKISRNHALLGSALDGIRAVAQRLADVRRVRDSLDTYDADGRKRSVPTPSEKNLEKRA